ncbi:MAG: AAA family ATPase, partial [Hapalosiphonaceae cyanobacterium JJU2]
MSKTTTAKLWTYITECARLLYWAYFKPYTFERWLRDIHLELKPNTNPLSKRTEFGTNPRLRRYAGQVWWITALAPWLIVIIVAPIYTLISHEAFRWFPSCLFLVGWMIGLALATFPQQRLKIILLVVAGFLAALAYSSFDVAYGVAYGVTFGVAFGVACGVAFGVAFGVA